MQPSGKICSDVGIHWRENKWAGAQRLPSCSAQHVVQHKRSRTHGEKMSGRGGHEETRWTLCNGWWRTQLTTRVRQHTSPGLWKVLMYLHNGLNSQRARAAHHRPRRGTASTTDKNIIQSRWDHGPLNLSVSLTIGSPPAGLATIDAMVLLQTFPVLIVCTRADKEYGMGPSWPKTRTKHISRGRHANHSHSKSVWRKS